MRHFQVLLHPDLGPYFYCFVFIPVNIRYEFLSFNTYSKYYKKDG